MPGLQQHLKRLRPTTFGGFYLGFFGCLYVTIGVLFIINPNDLLSGGSYRMLLDIVPRAFWGLMWMSCGVAMLVPLRTRNPIHRRLASAWAMNAVTAWFIGTVCAALLYPPSGALSEPLLLLGIGSIHYSVAKFFKTDDPNIWGRTKP